MSAIALIEICGDIKFSAIIVFSFSDCRALLSMGDDQMIGFLRQQLCSSVMASMKRKQKNDK